MALIFNEEHFRKPLLRSSDGDPVPVGMVYCVGRNYVKHIEEMKARNLGVPVIFTKPPAAVCQGIDTIPLPEQSKDVHHEIELALIIGKEGKDIPEVDALRYIAGAAVALDLTMRDIQAIAKKNGTPWAMAKGFDYSCPISKIYPVSGIDLSNVELILEKNGEVVQRGNTSHMLYSLEYLIAYLSTFFTLMPGDIILTGTPEGVGPIKKGDILSFSASFSEIVTIDFI